MGRRGLGGNGGSQSFSRDELNGIARSRVQPEGMIGLRSLAERNTRIEFSWAE